MRPLKILLVFDLSIPLMPEDYADYMKTDDWENEAHVLETLKKLGHTAKAFGIHDDIDPFIHEIKNERPDLIFNLSEAFNGDRRFEPHLPSLFELLGLKYTGAGPGALTLCKDKGLTKKLLAYQGIRVPRFEVVKKGQSPKELEDFPYPAFVKPLQLEASEGISQVSLTENLADTLDRVQFIHEKFEADAIIEEFIDGRELYVGVLGNERLNAFPPRELFFKEVPEGEPKIATFRAKWNDDYRKKWGIRNGPAASIPADVLEEMLEACKKIYRTLQLRGYGRIDLRLKPNGEFVFLEANPNPSIAKEDDFALSAAKADIPYDELIAKMISLSGV
ncbi:MAG: ATP-grasp domain-containing protein [Methylotenera sp.]|nr:ATP-grasp domain-containing protein [Oligoflexia bacterium]